MKHVAVVAALMCIATSSYSQDNKPVVPGPGGRQMMRFDAEHSVLIRELGAMLTEENKIVIVKFIPPKDRRPKEVVGEDIESGDEVGMANGKRVASAQDLRKQYEEAAIGSEFKMGLRREGQAHIVTFMKKDPKEMMQSGGMMMMTADGDGGSTRMLPAIGIAVEQKGSVVVIGRRFPNAPEGLKQDDTVESLNGKAVKTLDEFMKEFDGTKVGAELKFGLVREGKQVSFAMPRPEPRGQVIIR